MDDFATGGSEIVHFFQKIVKNFPDNNIKLFNVNIKRDFSMTLILDFILLMNEISKQLIEIN